MCVCVYKDSVNEEKCTHQCSHAFKFNAKTIFMFFYHFNRFLITKGCRSFNGIFVRKLAIKARKSYAYGASNIPLINQTIGIFLIFLFTSLIIISCEISGEIFREKVERNPDQEFVIFPADNGVRKTYAQCYDDVYKFSIIFHARLAV